MAHSVNLPRAKKRVSKDDVAKMVEGSMMEILMDSANEWPLDEEGRWRIEADPDDGEMYATDGTKRFRIAVSLEEA